MKLFSAITRKIKFREKDYVENNYIRDDGKAVIPISIENIDSLYMKHDYKKLVLSNEVESYIDEVASMIPFKHDIILEIHCEEIGIEEQGRIRKIIKNNYGMEIDDIDYDVRVSRWVSFVLFVIGVIILTVIYAFEDTLSGFVEELLFIVGWVVLWDMLESVLFTDNKRKLDRLNKMQLYDAKVEFVFDK